MVEIALDEFALVLARLFLAGGEIGAADDKFGQHDLRRRGAMELAVQLAPSLDDWQPHVPWPIGEHDHMRAELGGGNDGILARRHRINASVEGTLRPWADLDPRLLVELAVALDEPGLKRVDDHRGRLASRQAAAEPEAQPAFAQQIQHGRLFGDSQRVVPGDDDRGGAQVDVWASGREIRHQLEIVRHERVVVEVMLRRPQAVETEIGGEPREADFLLPHARIGAVLPAVAGEHHHHPNVHRVLLRS